MARTRGFLLSILIAATAGCGGSGPILEPDLSATCAADPTLSICVESCEANPDLEWCALDCDANPDDPACLPDCAADPSAPGCGGEEAVVVTLATAFPDINLRKAILAALDELGVDVSGTTVSANDLERIAEVEHAPCSGTECDAARIKTLTGLELLVNLTDLRLPFNSVTTTGAAAIANLAKLASLDLSHNMVSGATMLGKLANLASLDLSGNYVNDIKALANLVNLATLDLSSNYLVDVSGLASLANLTVLDLSSNKLVDISTLASLTSLTSLDLSGNQITNIVAVAYLTSLKQLDLADNRVADFAFLVALHEEGGLPSESLLTVYGNPALVKPPYYPFDSAKWLEYQKNVVYLDYLEKAGVTVVRENPE